MALRLEHLPGEVRVADLVIAEQRGAKRGIDRPVSVLEEKRRTAFIGELLDCRFGFGRLGQHHQVNAPLGDPRFLCGDFDQRLPEELLVIDAEGGDAGCDGLLDDIGRVEASAEADLDYRRVGGCPRKGEEGDGGRDLEEAGLDIVARVENLGEQSRKLRILDQFAGDADALVEADEVRAGEGVDRAAARLQCGAQESAGRAFAVGACDVKYGW